MNEVVSVDAFSREVAKADTVPELKELVDKADTRGLHAEGGAV